MLTFSRTSITLFIILACFYENDNISLQVNASSLTKHHYYLCMVCIKMHYYIIDCMASYYGVPANRLTTTLKYVTGFVKTMGTVINIKYSTQLKYYILRRKETA